MKEALPNGVDVGWGGTTSYKFLHEIFFASTAKMGVWHYPRRIGEGEVVDVRFKQYVPEGVSFSEWVNLLGADVEFFEHAHLTHMLGRSFLFHCLQPPLSWKEKIPESAHFSREEQEILLLAAIVHDWGELRVGDKPYPSKTPTDELEEIKAQEEVAGGRFSKSRDPILWGKIHQAFEIVNNRDSKLGRAFNVIEKLGYFRTGIIAWGKSRQTEREGRIELSSRLQWLAAEVSANHLPKLLEYAEDYPAVFAYLTDMKFFISDIFEQIPDSIFENYPRENRDSKMARFDEAKEGWFNFLESKGF